MAERVYGLTEASAKVLAAMADKHRQRLPDVGRRTRRVDESPGTTVKVVYITQDADGSTGGDNQAFASILGSVSVICNTAQDGTGDEITVYLTQDTKGVFFTGQRVRAGRISEPETSESRWLMVSPGETKWEEATADGDITGGGGFALLPYYRSCPSLTADTCRVAVLTFDSSMNIADGSTVWVSHSQRTGTFFAGDSPCPSE